MSQSILHSSAVLAILFAEPGERTARAAIEAGAAISVVNLSEVAARLSRDGMPATEVAEAVSALPVEVLDADRQIAIEAGNLYAVTRRFGFSLRDRFCIATALRTGRWRHGRAVLEELARVARFARPANTLIRRATSRPYRIKRNVPPTVQTR